WPAGSFEAAYRSNRAEAIDNVIDSDPIASAIRTMMTGMPTWTGTASDLLVVLFRIAGEAWRGQEAGLRLLGALASKLRRALTFLRKIGIEITFSREGHGRARLIHIATIRAASEFVSEGEPVAPAASSALTAEISQTGDNGASTLQPAINGADDVGDGGQRPLSLTARANALKNGSAAVPYRADANLGWSKKLNETEAKTWR